MTCPTQKRLGGLLKRLVISLMLLVFAFLAILAAVQITDTYAGRLLNFSGQQSPAEWPLMAGALVIPGILALIYALVVLLDSY